MEKLRISRREVESEQRQKKQRKGTLTIIANLTENKEVVTALQEQLDHGIYIDLASVLAWEEWLRDELNNKDD